MKYAGHNRYGMLTRFFMFYIVIILIIYSDQRSKYIIKDAVKAIKFWVILLGIFDIGLIIISMILSFCVIDVQSFKQIWVKKRKRAKTEISLDSVKSIKNLEITGSKNPI
jgi:formate-dependent nitrite reductase membrane component NrfD